MNKETSQHVSATTVPGLMATVNVSLGDRSYPIWIGEPRIPRRPPIQGR